MILAFSVLFIDESYPPVLLAQKANKIRLETKNWALHIEERETGTSFREMWQRYLVVPLEMLVEPICFFINLYAAFCYAIIYLYVSISPGRSS